MEQGEDGIDPALAGGIGGPAERKRDRPEPQFEQAGSARRLQIIMALGGRPADKLDLPLVEAEALVGGAAVRLERAVVGQEYPSTVTYIGREGVITQIGSFPTMGGMKPYRVRLDDLSDDCAFHGHHLAPAQPERNRVVAWEDLALPFDPRKVGETV